MRRIVVPLALVMLSTLFAGCSLQRPVAQHAVAYNRAVEQAHNQTVLLNVVRSMKRRPQHYTAISSVLGTATSSLNPSLAFTLLDGAKTPWNPRGSATRSEQSLVTVSVLDDKDFVSGLLSPISLAQLEFFLSQGWPEDLLGMLFVRRIDIHDDAEFSHDNCDGPGTREIEDDVYIYSNEPADVGTADPFAAVRCFATRMWYLRNEEGLKIADKATTQVLAELETEDADKLAKLVLEAKEAGLKVVPGKPKDCSSSSGAAEEDSAHQACTAIPYKITKSSSSKVIRWGGIDASTQSEDFGAAQKQYREEKAKAGQPGGDKEKLRPALVYLRSAQNVVYYLGEIMRAQQGYSPSLAITEMEPRILEGKDSSSLLFLARQQGPSDKDPIVEVDDGEHTYVIPAIEGCENGKVVGCHRSMQVLAIVKQLIGLNKKVENLSTRTVVTTTAGG